MNQTFDAFVCIAISGTWNSPGGAIRSDGMPDKQTERAEALLDESVANQVRAERRSAIQAAPAEPGSDHLTFESDTYRYAAQWLEANEANDACAPFALVLSRSVILD